MEIFLAKAANNLANEQWQLNDIWIMPAQHVYHKVAVSAATCAYE